jgi:hypothetical protein
MGTAFFPVDAAAVLDPRVAAAAAAAVAAGNILLKRTLLI